jgi:ATP/maltotriose-dependent transcriptional regulator MalT/DNA-binding SARP family transcriptional activator
VTPTQSRGEARATAAVVATKVRVPNVPSMEVDRLDARLDVVWNHRLGLVVAPAGSGKTSLLARLAARTPGPVAWYRAEGWDSDEASLVRHLEAALAPALSGIDRPWEVVADVANTLASWPGARILLVVDDLHTLAGTKAEAALERLIEYAPPTLTVVAASRVPPGFNLSRLRVSGQLVELTGEDLRFRSWEVERLFRDFYEEPLPPEDLARLARRTEGWAAGLQLFHLATRGRPPEERRRLLGELGVQSRLAREMRDYLARNVLDQLPHDVRRFLIETAVLGKLSAPLCDRLLGRDDGHEVLEDLERRRLFTNRLPEDGWFRYHEVLRSHLLAVLLEEVGASGLRERFCTAGSLLAESEALPEAVEAFCRGEDWDRVRSLLGRNGREVALGHGTWLDALPPAIVAQDPWLLVANARALRAEGRVAEAVASYRRAETAFGPSDAGSMCRAERQAVGDWVADARSPQSERLGPFALLRASLAREPLVVVRTAERLGTPEGDVVAGLAAIAAGHVARARRDLVHAAEAADTAPALAVVAALGAAIAGLLMGQRHADREVEGAVAAAEEAGIEWLARMGRASLALGGADDALREAEAVAAVSRRLGDRWGEALARMCGAWGAAAAERPIGHLDGLVELLRSLDAGTLEAWARGLAALVAARSGAGHARDAVAAAETAALTLDASPASLCAHLALALLSGSPDEADEHVAAADAIARETGLLAPRVRRPEPAAPDANASVTRPPAPGRPLSRMPGSAPPLAIRLFGRFELSLDGSPVDLSTVRPRARALLRLLCLDAGTAVHHETIEAALWPASDAASSSRNLHVAIASLRRALEPGSARGSFHLLRREGDAYRLAVPDDAEIDLQRFERALAAARLAAARAEEEAARRGYEDAFALYAGELLPEDGPAEWVADRRELTRLGAVEAAQWLAELLLRRGDAEAAARVASAGLRIERYHDPLWRLLIQSRDEAGHQGAATRARSGYDKMLADLGVQAGVGP